MEEIDQVVHSFDDTEFCNLVPVIFLQVI